LQVLNRGVAKRNPFKFRFEADPDEPFVRRSLVELAAAPAPAPAAEGQRESGRAPPAAQIPSMAAATTPVPMPMPAVAVAVAVDAAVPAVLPASGAAAASARRKREEDFAEAAAAAPAKRRKDMMMNNLPKEPDAFRSAMMKFLGEKLTCAVCFGVMVAPHATACGHTFCGPCIFKWISKKPSCPECRFPISGANPSRVLDDLLRVAVEPTIDEAEDVSGMDERRVEWEKRRLMLENLDQIRLAEARALDARATARARAERAERAERNEALRNHTVFRFKTARDNMRNMISSRAHGHFAFELHPTIRSAVRDAVEAVRSANVPLGDVLRPGLDLENMSDTDSAYVFLNLVERQISIWDALAPRAAAAAVPPPPPPPPPPQQQLGAAAAAAAATPAAGAAAAPASASAGMSTMGLALAVVVNALYPSVNETLIRVVEVAEAAVQPVRRSERVRRMAN